MAIQVHSPGWKIRRRGSRGATRDAARDPSGVPPRFLTSESRVAQEVVLERASSARGRDFVDDELNLTYDLPAGNTAVLALRLPSGALTFHLPVPQKTRGLRGASQVRFQVTVPKPNARGVLDWVIKAIVIQVAKIAADKAARLLLPRLATTVETTTWKKLGLTEGWLKVTKETLASGALVSGTPVAPERSLLFLHGPFSHAAGSFGALARSGFFDSVRGLYGDRIFAFDHFSVSRTPAQNARMLLERLPDHATTFDVIAHSRGALVLRELVERASQFEDLARRFTLGHAVLVGAPNEGTPLATPARWDETVGWLANLLELLPDNPLTTGAAFVANGLVWLANHASGDLPGIRAMDGDGDAIASLQRPPGPPDGAYSALAANYQPADQVVMRLVDAGMDRFFGSANDLMVPTEGGWRIDRSRTKFIPASRIGCFGPGGNLPPDSVTHFTFFTQPATVDFLANALAGRPHALRPMDVGKSLPARRSPHLREVALVTSKIRAPRRGKTAGRASVQKKKEDEPLRITVTNGDLTFEREPLLLGHYRAMRLTGTEAVMDKLIGGTMARSLAAGLYPASVGSHQLFVNTRPNLDRGMFMPRPKAVIVVGLGEEGKLQSAGLTSSVRQAVIAWAQREAETSSSGRRLFQLATTLIGSGGTGIAPGEAARLVAQGVADANAALEEESGGAAWPRVNHLHFVELYLDRAAEAWRALRMQEAATPGRYAIGDRVMVGTGPLRRPPDSGYRGADYDLISVQTMEDAAEPQIVYTLDTKRARSEVRAQRTQSALIRDLVTNASSDQNRDRQIGCTLFNLLIPVELEAYLSGSGEMVMELDAGTARIPWELLDPDSTQAPWAIRVKLLRKLRIDQFREEVTDADASANVLIIGGPEAPKEYPRLYGARREAEAVRAALTEEGGLEESLVTTLVSSDDVQPGPDARAVVNAMFSKAWRIVHIAGHGKPATARVPATPDTPAAPAMPGGVVLSNGGVLGPDELGKLRTVPELVFVNCCHLASGDPNQLLKYDRPEFASSVAAALIAIGVRCVIAAGWAVDDDAAAVFAEAFYASLLRGNRFIDAVDEARRATYESSPHVNTWAAYQCYGDPDWVFRASAPDPNRASASAAGSFADLASAEELKLALERIVVQTKFQGADPPRQIRTLNDFEKLFGGTWGSSGAVAELFGEAFTEAGDVEKGRTWYERAVNAPDATASMKAAEQLANVSSRLGWELVDDAIRGLDGSPRRAASRRSLMEAVTRADALIDRSIELLEKLIAVEPTMERATLIGSAYKRRALVHGAAERHGPLERDLRQMKASYQRAQDVGAKSDAAELYYPAANVLAADVALNAGRRGWRGPDRKLLGLVRDGLKARNDAEADFWSVVGEIEVRQYEALGKRSLTAARSELEKAYEDLHKRVTAARMWASVYDTASLVLPVYASRVTDREKAAAEGVLSRLRAFAHPEAKQ
jgi:CHAT domain-containing protein